MRIISDYLRLMLFLGGALIGVQVPSFVDLYGVRLESRLNESALSLRAFQTDADVYFNGDLQQLIQHYQRSSDPVIVAGGNNINAIFERNKALVNAHTHFNHSLYSRYVHTFSAPIPEIQSTTWTHYDHAIKLNASGITWALSVGFIVSFILEALWLILGRLSQQLRLVLLRTHAPTDSIKRE